MLSREDALELTEKIKSNLREFGGLIKKARDEKAWQILGYPSFSDWIQFAVGISRARAYQLVNIASLEEQLRGIGVFPEDFTISSRTAQEIMNSGSKAFMERMQSLISEDENENEASFADLVTSIREALNDTSSTASPNVIPITGIRDMNRHVFIALNSLMAQVNDFPAPAEVENQHLETVRGKLKEAIEFLEAQVEEYSNPEIVASANA
jgi:hypothetical protein